MVLIKFVTGYYTLVRETFNYVLPFLYYLTFHSLRSLSAMIRYVFGQQDSYYILY